MKNPIIFGDFIKVGADKSDRVYEELSNVDKVKQALGDVSCHVTCKLYDLCFYKLNAVFLFEVYLTEVQNCRRVLYKK